MIKWYILMWYPLYNAEQDPSTLLVLSINSKWCTVNNLKFLNSMSKSFERIKNGFRQIWKNNLLQLDCNITDFFRAYHGNRAYYEDEKIRAGRKITIVPISHRIWTLELWNHSFEISLDNHDVESLFLFEESAV